MLRYCNICNCELNGSNAAKKDARRFRKICRTCFREKRNRSRIGRDHNQSAFLDTLIERSIVKVDSSMDLSSDGYSQPYLKIDDTPKKGFLFYIINMIKNFIERDTKDAL